MTIIVHSSWHEWKERSNKGPFDVSGDTRYTDNADNIIIISYCWHNRMTVHRVPDCCGLVLVWNNAVSTLLQRIVLALGFESIVLLLRNRADNTHGLFLNVLNRCLRSYTVFCETQSFFNNLWNCYVTVFIIHYYCQRSIIVTYQCNRLLVAV